MPKRYILCVDDEKVVLTSLKQQLVNGLGSEFSFEIAESGEEGLEIIGDILKAGHQLPVVISDQLMPGMKGDQFLVKVKQLSTHTRKILLTGQASAQAVGNAVNAADLYRFISKPWNSEDLLKTVREAAKSYLQDHKLEAKIKLLTQITGYAELQNEHIHLAEWSEDLLGRLVKDVNASRGLIAVRLGSNGSAQTQYVEASRKGQEVQLRKIDAKALTENYPVSILTESMGQRKRITLANAQDVEAYAEDPQVQKQRLKSVFCTPLYKKDQTFGALYLDSPERPKLFEDEALELLEAIARQSALSLENILTVMDLEAKVSEKTQSIRDEHHSMRDSIYYASRIQQTMLTQPDHIQASFADSFVLFKPKDIVSGDFYWFEVIDGAAYLAVADCTGHGVPGAFLTMLGMNLLDRIIRDQRVRQPVAILETLHQSYRKQLRQDMGSALLDGMEIALCRIDLETREATFATAHRSVYCYTGGALQKVSTSKKAVGGKDAPAASKASDDQFAEQTLSLAQGDAIYLLTDGIADQFAEDNKKKFSSKRLEELLTASQTMSMADQAKTLETRIKVWRGSNQQTDDMLIVGLRV